MRGSSRVSSKQAQTAPRIRLYSTPSEKDLTLSEDNMNVKELYDALEKRIPKHLSEEWDNDGLMCSPDLTQNVKRAICTLDITEEICDYAVDMGVDLIVSHHPLVFRPVSALTEENNVQRKLMKLVSAGISVFSFHTRADKIEGGVNDILADMLGLREVSPFGEGGLGRCGVIDDEMSTEDFAYKVKTTLGTDCLKYADAYNTVSKVCVVGGDGKSFVSDALKSGADTFVSGRIGYNVMAEAGEMGINLLEAGHFFTEQPVTQFFQALLHRLDPDMYIEIMDSNVIRLI
jgi:dinuclear metal center YbgI/SA1388 family protein